MQVKPEKNALLYNFLYTIFKRQRLIFALSIVTFILIVFGTWLTTPTWDGESKVFVRNQTQQNLALIDDLTIPVRDNPKINPGSNLIQILYSRSLAEEVVREFKLDERLKKQQTDPASLLTDKSSYNPEGRRPARARFRAKNALMTVLRSPVTLLKAVFGAGTEEKNYFQDAVELLMENSEKFEIEQSSQVITVCVEEQDPVLASQISAYMSDALLKRSREMDNASSHNALEFSTEKLAEAEADLKKAEDVLMRYTGEAGIVDIVSEKEAKLEQISRAETELYGVLSSLAQAKARLEGLNTQVAEQRKLLNASTLVSSNSTVAQLKQGLNVLEANLAGAKARLVSLEKQIEQHKKEISPSTVVSSNAVIADLKERLNDLEMQLAGAQENFAPGSKAIKQLNSQIETNKNLLKSEMGEILKNSAAVLNAINRNLSSDLVETMASIMSFEAQIGVNTAALEKEITEITKNELAVLNAIHSNLPLDFVETMTQVVALEARRDVLTSQIEQFRGEGRSLTEKGMEIERLSRSVGANRELYTNLLNKCTQLKIQAVSEVGGYDLTIIDRANLPGDAKQDWPSWPLNILLGLVASLLLGMGGAFFTEYWIENFRSPKDVEDRVGLTVLCTIPDIPSKRKQLT